MPVYLYWGDDSFRLEAAVQQLRQQVLDPDWVAFNYDRVAAEATISGLNQAMTPPMGMGDRLVWLADTKLLHQCSEDLLSEWERTLAHVPDTTHLLLTTDRKPDGRLKSTKLVKQLATVKEFSLLPPWDTEGILAQIQQTAHDLHMDLTPAAAELLATAVGNDSRTLAMELEKLALLAGERSITPDMVQQLVPASAHNSFQLAAHLRQRDTSRALDTLSHLLDRNEPALKILAVLVNQVRTWLWIKLLTQEGQRDIQVMAQMAEVGNPKRVYFLQKEVKSLSLDWLHHCLIQLLELEVKLKQGHPEREAFPLALIQITTAHPTASSRQRH